MLQVTGSSERFEAFVLADASGFRVKLMVWLFLQDCGATLRVAIHDAECRATMRLRRAAVLRLNEE